MTQDKQLTIKRLGRRANDQRPTTNDQPDLVAHRFYPGRPRRSERGYILLMLMLFVALLAIAAGALAPSIAFRVRRDREEEMIHRGVQYSRAIRRYVKKTGRYPTRIEELENTNNLRFLRKRYKDPITGQDFKLLHVGDVQLMGMPGMAGAAGIAGATPVGGGAAPGGAALAGAASTLLGGAATQAAPAASAAATAAAGTPDNATQDASQANSGAPDPSKADESHSSGSISSSQLSSAVFGGGPIVGVASTSKARSIREFNHKNHYNQWQFIYDPSMDRGGLITTPAQPALQGAAPLQQQNSTGSAGSMGGAPSPPPAQPTQQQ